jgi:serine/threonine-protein kinase
VTDDTPRPLREINASVPEWLEALIAKLQAKDPADRIQTAHEAAVLLKACLAHVQQPTVAYLPDEVMAFTKQYRRSRWKPLVALLVISATLIALGFAFGPESDTSSGQQSETGPATAEAPPEPAIAPSSEPVLSKWDDDLEPEAAQIRERLNELEVETSF